MTNEYYLRSKARVRALIILLVRTHNPNPTRWPGLLRMIGWSRRVGWSRYPTFCENNLLCSRYVGVNICERNSLIYKWYGPIYRTLYENPTAKLRKVTYVKCMFTWSSAFVSRKVMSHDHLTRRDDPMIRSKPNIQRAEVGFRQLCPETFILLTFTIMLNWQLQRKVLIDKSPNAVGVEMDNNFKK